MRTQSLVRVRLQPPYLLFLGDCPDNHHAKTGAGLAHWRPEHCRGQMRLPDCPVDLGIEELSVDAAVEAGIRTAVVGVAPVGGAIPDTWLAQLTGLARAGIDIASGLHTRLTDVDALVDAAAAGGADLIDVRVPPAGIPVGNGAPRSGKRLLTVGTDCAVGKKYTALALHRELLRRGQDATFRATGQTGILIAGEGMPIDAVVADFVSGAAELLSPASAEDHWDVIEGQGSLLHPGYAAVSLGLMFGSQPDAIVLCHDAARKAIDDAAEGYAIPALDEVIDDALRLARRTNPRCFCAGVSVNTSSLTDFERDRYLARLQHELAIPCVDSVAIGVSPIVDFLLRQFPQTIQ